MERIRKLTCRDSEFLVSTFDSEKIQFLYEEYKKMSDIIFFSKFGLYRFSKDVNHWPNNMQKFKLFLLYSVRASDS